MEAGATDVSDGALAAGGGGQPTGGQLLALDSLRCPSAGGSNKRTQNIKVKIGAGRQTSCRP